MCRLCAVVDPLPCDGTFMRENREIRWSPEGVDDLGPQKEGSMTRDRR